MTHKPVVAVCVTMAFLMSIGAMVLLGLYFAHHEQPYKAIVVPAPSWPGAAGVDVTCLGLDHDLKVVIRDLNAANREAWTTGGKSDDLQALIDDTEPALNGTTPMDQDAATFNTDAAAYLNQNYPVVESGWQAEYTQVTADVNVLAGDCHLHGVVITGTGAWK